MNIISKCKTQALTSRASVEGRMGSMDRNSYCFENLEYSIRFIHVRNLITLYIDLCDYNVQWFIGIKPFLLTYCNITFNACINTTNLIFRNHFIFPVNSNNIIYYEYVIRWT